MFKSLKGKYRTLNTVRVFEAALSHNLNLHRKLVPGLSVCPVLKSNAYGHGLVNVAKIMEKEDTDFIIVDSLFEAYTLTKAGIKSPILILGYTFPENLKRKHLPFHLTVSDLKTAEALSELDNPVHIEIDTGMSRMGFSPEELDEALERIKELKLNVVGVFTHLADADNIGEDFTEKQMTRFKKAVDKVKSHGFDPKWIHIANSAGALKTENATPNMMRLGISLYGISPYIEEDPKNEALIALQPAMEVVSTLIAIRKLKIGDKVSYGCTYEAPMDMTIGVIPFGYYEGLDRSLSNKGFVEVNGISCPIIGRICMNHTMINLKQAKAELGDEVLVYSRDSNKENSFFRQAQKAETIPYELLVRIAESVRREVV